MLNQKIVDTVEALRVATRNFPKIWDGKNAILEMKEGGSRNWKQMEWQGWYFQYLCNSHFKGILDMPGKTYGNVEFDAFSEITWDFKSHASTSKSRDIICNDTEAILNTIADYGYYGIILAVGEAEYNDEDGTFKAWHDDLKGEKSKYVLEQENKYGKSRIRKTKFVLSKIDFACFDLEALRQCGGSFQEGFRNADGSLRRKKVSISTRKIPNDVFIATEVF